MSLYTYPSGQVTIIAPPSGYVANFEHPQRQYVEPIYWVSGVLFTLSCLFMGQRGYTNAFLNRKFFIEDVLLLISWVSGHLSVCHCHCVLIVFASCLLFWRTYLFSVWLISIVRLLTAN